MIGKKITKLILQNKVFISIAIIFFVVPLFWLKPGELNLGGDANRLYFYDPISFLKYTAVFDISGQGKGIVEPKYFYIPYVIVISILRNFLSTTSTINLFNSIKLSGGFIFVYFISFTLISQLTKFDKWKAKYSSIISGIFYTVSFTSLNMAFFWDRPLFTHDQIFLNPAVFFFLLKFFTTKKYIYLWIAILISFVFSTNFSLLGSAPPLFSFYPISIFFLILYFLFFGKYPFPWKGLVVGTVFFILLHAFHLLGEIFSFFEKGSIGNTLVVDKRSILAEGVGYFEAIHQHGKAAISLFLPPEKREFSIVGVVVFPLIVTVGLFINKRKEFLLIFIFLIVTFFLVTANITDLGYEIYKKLFYLPGFAMFRNFYTQWMYVYIFFYSIVLSFSVYYIFEKLKVVYVKLFFFGLIIILIVIGHSLLFGDVINNVYIRGSNSVRTVFEMDTNYIETLSFIDKLPKDGKIIVFPLTDFFRQVISGKNGGAYEGPSTILHLTSKYSFVGYQDLGYKNNSPYAEEFLKYTREKNYAKLIQILNTLNVRYVLYNNDPMAYEKGFNPGSYGYMMTSMPKTQKEYKKYLSNFPLKFLFKKGHYTIYELRSEFYNPTIFIPNDVYTSDRLKYGKSMASVFVNKKNCSFIGSLCRNYHKSKINLEFIEVNPVSYKFIISGNLTNDMLIVLQHSYHNGWKVKIGNDQIEKHMIINGYANGWVIPAQNNANKKIEGSIYLEDQKYFWFGWIITLVVLGSLISLIIISFLNTNEK